MRTKESFTRTIIEEVKIHLGNAYVVTVTDVLKNNGVYLTGLLIRKNNSTIASTIYIDEFYDAYIEEYLSINEIVQRILSVYRESAIEVSSKITSIFSSKDEVLSRVCYRLINRDKNAEFLREAPHTDVVGDLTKIFFVLIDTLEINGQGTVKITNQLMENLEITFNELEEAAEKNTEEVYKAHFSSMTEVITEILGIPNYELPLFPNEMGMYVLSNETKFNGASTVLYKGMLTSISHFLNDSLYILPSSCHEVIILKASDVGRKEDLEVMVHEVNENEVSIQDYLSDYVFFFNKATETLCVA